MPFRGTYSPRTVLEAIRDSVVLVPSLATESTINDVKVQVEEMLLELKRTRLGHQLHLWGSEVELEEED